MAAIMPVRRGGAVRTLACGAACLAAAAFGCLPAFTAPSRAWHPAVSEEPRGLREPRTVMRGRYATGTRSGKFMQGRGRLPMPHNRRPVLAYSIEGEMVRGPKDKSNPEAAGSVLRRLWDMYDQDYNKMMAQRTRYFKKENRLKYWNLQWIHNSWRREKRRRDSRKRGVAWTEWMRQNGKKMGFTTPITYDGPSRPVGKEVEAKIREAIDAAGSIKAFKRQFYEKDKSQPLSKTITDWIPGQWPAPDDKNNVFRYYKRPLHKYPYDIAKMGKRGRAKIQHGNVI